MYPQTLAKRRTFEACFHLPPIGTGLALTSVFIEVLAEYEDSKPFTIT
jgi:hypothetical protein